MKAKAILCLLFFGLILTPAALSAADSHELTGGASWYGEQFHGKLTASGQIYDMHELTAAHKTLPFGTQVRVTDLSNGRSVTVTVTDRGPFVKDRVIDLSFRAAQELDLVYRGVTQVIIEPIGQEVAPPEFAVQVASYGSRLRAAQLLASLSTHPALKDLGLSPVIQEQTDLFRVMVPLDREDQAESVIQVAAELGFTDAFKRKQSGE